jgi:hypothetical protein
MHAPDGSARTATSWKQNTPAEPDFNTQTMSRIRIANPQPGSAKYTSASRAERFVRRKEAVMVDGELHFLSPTEQWKMRTFVQTIKSERRASDVYIRGIVWWDGRDPGGMHRPGEVIS